MKTTSIIVLATGLTLAGASGVAAQTVDPKAYVDLNIAGQTQSVTIATSSTFSLYGEPGATSSSQTVGKGLVFDGGAGYFVRKNLAIGIVVSMGDVPLAVESSTAAHGLLYAVRFSSDVVTSPS
jgi:hypothetical protein